MCGKLAPFLLTAAVLWSGNAAPQAEPAGDGIFLAQASEPTRIPQRAAGDETTPQPEGPYITLPESLTVAPGKFLTVPAKTNGKTVKWRLRADDLALFPVERTKDSLAATVIGYVEGTYELEAWTALGDEATDIAVCLVKVDDGKDDNEPPPEPTPDDDTKPKPPTPDTKPPFPTDGLAVLITYSTDTQHDLTAGQRAIIFSTAFRQFLNGVCPVGPDGRTPEYRIWDDDSEVSDEATKWKAAMAVPRGAEEWVVISTKNKGGYSGPMPAGPEEFKALLQPFVE